jgi:predicted MFS family arabinose efflux permease
MERGAQAIASGEGAAPGRALRLLAVVAGLSVANLYYAQPLAAMMADALGVGASAIGVSLMLSLMGYALGMLLLVPLGDGRERRDLMMKTAFAASATLLLVAAAPSFPTLAAASFLLGFASCLPQMAVPFAVGLVAPAERGRAIGLVMGGLLAGILLSRTASGALGALIGWRATFVCAAGVMVVTAVTLRAALPAQRPSEPLAYPAILRSLGAIVKREPILRRQSLVGACGFASFSVFWSTLAFHLARLGHGSETAGLFGAVGISGMAAAPIVGRLAGRVRPTRINVIGLAAVMLGFAVFVVAPHSLLGIGVGVVLLDVGVQASHLANQTIIFGLAPEYRNRTNAVYMVSYFIGGSIGTLTAALVWERWGWTGVSALGATYALFGVARLGAAKRSRAEQA